jgi:S-adenosylmethionine-diacylglycerol 3-amino-3-carboxypropyl transferase
MSNQSTHDSTVHFSQVREDPKLELALLDDLAQRLDRPLRALVVGSGGCTALSLLAHPHIARVDAIDINQAQLHLIELRRHALAQLSLDDQLRLIGETEEVSSDARIDLYESLAGHLPKDTRAYWDRHQEHIGKGIQHIGQFELLLQELKEVFTKANIDPITHPAHALGIPNWPHTFQKVFDRARLQQLFGAAMVGYSASKSFAQHFSQCFARALREFSGRKNYFLNQIFHNRYDVEGKQLPPYLEEENQEVIRKHGVDRLHLHHGNFQGTMLRLAEEHGPYDLIQTSDLTDWLPIPSAHALLKGVQKSLGDGGVLLARRMNADHNLSSLVQNHLNVDTALSARFAQTDRSFLYSEIVVGFRPALAT